ncbi:TPA: type I toxin-antitoxin system Fst family toxin [Staphylococcus aureus]|nr:type I toxin-antitoxin system Fst family toxin [Staphylococcus aureus]HDH6611528.1 type I toxin-antitoxin system Fst family toxin [Staphylococcus aureus]HDH6642992.1 type I toxin-antitoxin system Fst family toxin [Staphylococcus aureus]HDH6645514.1 type I toxin-antitoxin system Fst family toxin [Staphylococcus aureus]HDH6648011.1 type I toxin-antitoxin system Fst family toxin [Staphylococcus aureus]
MIEVLIHIITTVISGCIIALFTQWLRKRNNKKNRRC